MSFLLEAKGLYKVYKKDSSELEVLHNVNLQIQAGESWVIVGASGAGKSTLLHILGGLDSPTQGEVFYQGENLFKKSESQLASFRNSSLGFVFQFHHLLPLFTALENVMMPGLIAGETKEKAKKSALDLLKRVGLEKRAFHRPQELSGGEQQRVALARALVLKPKIVMADEPTGNLDTETSRKVFHEMIKLHEEFKTTLIVVTHNDELAAQFQRKVWMQDGKVS